MLDDLELKWPEFKSMEEAQAYDARADRMLAKYRGINRIGFLQYRLRYRPKGYPEFDRIFRDVDQAIAVHATLKSMRRSGDYEPPAPKNSETLGTLLKRYADEVAPRRSSYPERDKSRLYKLAEYPVAKMPAGKLTRQHFNAWRAQRRSESRKVKGADKNISRKTIKDELSLMKRVLQYAEDEWNVALPHGNPIDVRRTMAYVDNDAVKRKAISKKNVEAQLLEACAEYGDGHTLRDLVELALATACRRGELVGLAWERIFIEERIMRVRNKNRRKDGEEWRKVPLSDRAIGVLDRIGIREEGPVFPYSNPDSVTRALARVRAKHPDIPDFEFITPHTLRHTAVTNLQRHGASPEQVRAYSGHSTTLMLDNYSHLEAEDVLDVLNEAEKGRT